MEVLLTHQCGIPEGSIVSVRSGKTRRQAPVSVLKEHTLKFPPCPENAEPLKLDVLLPIATARLVLQPQEEHYHVGLDARGDYPMALGVHVKTSGASSSSAPGLFDASATFDTGSKHTEAANCARQYLESHGLLQYFQGLLHVVIQQKPDNPYYFLWQQLGSLSKDNWIPVDPGGPQRPNLAHCNGRGPMTTPAQEEEQQRPILGPVVAADENGVVVAVDPPYVEKPDTAKEEPLLDPKNSSSREEDILRTDNAQQTCQQVDVKADPHCNVSSEHMVGTRPTQTASGGHDVPATMDDSKDLEALEATSKGKTTHETTTGSGSGMENEKKGALEPETATSSLPSELVVPGSSYPHVEVGPVETCVKDSQHQTSLLTQTEELVPSIMGDAVTVEVASATGLPTSSVLEEQRQIDKLRVNCRAMLDEAVASGTLDGAICPVDKPFLSGMGVLSSQNRPTVLNEASAISGSSGLNALEEGFWPASLPSNAEEREEVLRGRMRTALVGAIQFGLLAELSPDAGLDPSQLTDARTDEASKDESPPIAEVAEAHAIEECLWSPLRPPTVAREEFFGGRMRTAVIGDMACDSLSDVASCVLTEACHTGADLGLSLNEQAGIQGHEAPKGTCCPEQVAGKANEDLDVEKQDIDARLFDQGVSSAQVENLKLAIRDSLVQGIESGKIFNSIDTDADGTQAVLERRHVEQGSQAHGHDCGINNTANLDALLQEKGVSVEDVSRLKHILREALEYGTESGKIVDWISDNMVQSGTSPGLVDGEAVRFGPLERSQSSDMPVDSGHDAARPTAFDRPMFSQAEPQAADVARTTPEQPQAPDRPADEQLPAAGPLPELSAQRSQQTSNMPQGQSPDKSGNQLEATQHLQEVPAAPPQQNAEALQCGQPDTVQRVDALSQCPDVAKHAASPQGGAANTPTGEQDEAVRFTAQHQREEKGECETQALVLGDHKALTPHSASSSGAQLPPLKTKEKPLAQVPNPACRVQPLPGESCGSAVAAASAQSAPRTRSASSTEARVRVVPPKAPPGSMGVFVRSQLSDLQDRLRALKSENKHLHDRVGSIAQDMEDVRRSNAHVTKLLQERSASARRRPASALPRPNTGSNVGPCE